MDVYFVGLWHVEAIGSEDDVHIWRFWEMVCMYK